MVGVDGVGLRLAVQSLGAPQSHSWYGLRPSGLRFCGFAVAADERLRRLHCLFKPLKSPGFGWDDRRSEVSETALRWHSSF
jgi:hypothetical protein